MNAKKTDAGRPPTKSNASRSGQIELSEISISTRPGSRGSHLGAGQRKRPSVETVPSVSTPILSPPNRQRPALIHEVWLRSIAAALTSRNAANPEPWMVSITPPEMCEPVGSTEEMYGRSYTAKASGSAASSGRRLKWKRCAEPAEANSSSAASRAASSSAALAAARAASAAARAALAAASSAAVWLNKGSSPEAASPEDASVWFVLLLEGGGEVRGAEGGGGRRGGARN